jgi:predicted nucleotidyltransferase
MTLEYLRQGLLDLEGDVSTLEELIKRQPELGFLPRLVKLATDRLGDTKIILFGSRARQDYRRLSDVDILVDGTPVDDRSWARLLSELDDLPTLLPIDLIRWDEAESGLLNRARSEGIVIHE